MKKKLLKAVDDASSEIYIGIDPGTTTSPTGFICLVAAENGKFNVRGTCSSFPDPKFKDLPSGLRWDATLSWRIHQTVTNFINFLVGALPILALGSSTKVHVFCEEPYLLGKANKNMLKLLGALEVALLTQASILKFAYAIHYVDPSTSKKVVAGHGAAEKDVVFQGVMSRLNVTDGRAFMADDKVCYDISDAAAAIIAGGTKFDMWK